MSDIAFNLQYELIIEDLLKNQYCVSDTFFSFEQVELLRSNLKAKQQQANFVAAGIGNQHYKQVLVKERGDFILWLQGQSKDPVERIFLNKIQDFTNYLNATCYTGIDQGEFHYACYPQGAFYKRHLDVFQSDNKRRFSVVLYLNELDYELCDGGDLVVFPKDEQGVETSVVIAPLPGRLVLFDSRTLEHQVNPVLNKQRYSLTGWLKTR